MSEIRGNTNAYARWNIPAEWFGYVKNQLYAPLFPHNRALKGGQPKPAATAGKGKGKQLAKPVPAPAASVTATVAPAS